MVKQYESLNEAIRNLFGSSAVVAAKRPVSGGDSNRAYALRISEGSRLFLKAGESRAAKAAEGSQLFLKANIREKADFFRAEAEGLEAIRRTGTVRVPEVLAAGTDGPDAFLLMEYVESGRVTGEAMEKLGSRLAEMHGEGVGQTLCHGQFGFPTDNYIGLSRQSNTPHETWREFFVEERLRPQLMQAAGYWAASERGKLEAFLERAGEYLVEPERPALLHGDLWGGNYMIDRAGEPWLIDPAVYIGHPEADLAMTELFGGFGDSFYKAYHTTSPIDPGYRGRRDLYNLYHLLNHLNLFGSVYLYSVKSVMEQYL